MLKYTILIILILFISACDEGINSNDNVAAKPLQMSLSMTDIQGNVKSDFHVGDTISFTFTITNSSAQTINYTHTGEPRVISVVDNSGAVLWSSNEATIQVELETTLAPSEQLKLIVPWATVQRDQKTAMPAGNYTVVPSIALVPQNLVQDFTPLALNLTIIPVAVIFATLDQNGNASRQFKVGDNVKIDFRIKNNTNMPVSYSYSGFGHDIAINQSKQRVWTKYDSVAITGQVKYATIPANGELDYSVIWDGKSNSGNQMPIGDYSIEPQLMIHSLSGIDTTLEWSTIQAIVIQYRQDISRESSPITVLFNIKDEYLQPSLVFNRSEDVILAMQINNRSALPVIIELSPNPVNYTISQKGIPITSLELEAFEYQDRDEDSNHEDETDTQTPSDDFLSTTHSIPAFGYFTINMILSDFDENLTTVSGDLLITPVYTIYINGRAVQSPEAQTITIQ